MLKRFIEMLAVTALAVSSSFACNYRILEMEADSINGTMWAGHTISENTINKSLTFIEDIDKVEEKYKQSNLFSSLYQHYTQKINDETFKDFAQKCRSMYESRRDSLAKTALTILFDSVGKKYYKDYLRFERYNKESALRPAYSPQSTSDNNNYFDKFFGIGVSTK